MIKHRACGLFGGYLILNPTGRPLEFHCTAAVQPSRAQEILYGPTLQAYLQAELIGRALYEHARRSPPVVLTDRRAVVQLDQYTDARVAYVHPGGDSSSAASVSAHTKPGSEQPAPGDRTSRRRGGWVELNLDDVTVAYPAPQADRFGPLHELLRSAARRVDLREPFSRIRFAIREAHQIRCSTGSRAA